MDEIRELFLVNLHIRDKHIKELRNMLDFTLIVLKVFIIFFVGVSLFNSPDLTVLDVIDWILIAVNIGMAIHEVVRIVKRNREWKQTEAEFYQKMSEFNQNTEI